MTRDEHRAKCIEAMTIAYAMSRGTEEPCFYKDMTAAFDSLHGVAFVDPIEVTEEMIMHARIASNTTHENLWRLMAARGNLTNQQEEKP